MEIYQDKLIVGGTFSQAGNVSASRIAAWDGVQWSALGNGVSREPFGLAVYNGDLYALTDLALSRWNGTNWSQVQLPPGATYYNGAIESHAGLLFAGSGQGSATRLSWWNGASWASAPLPISGQSIVDMQSVGGQLYIAGVGDSIIFPHSRVERPSRAASQDLGFMYQWDGAAFHGPGLMGSTFPTCLHAHEGLVFVGGDGDMPNGGFGIVAWDGSNWVSSTVYYPCCVFAMETYHGWLMLGYLGGVTGYDGPVQHETGAGYTYVFGLKTYHDELYVTGAFDAIGGVPAANISSWYDPVVVGVPRGTTANVLAVTCAPNPFNPSVNLTVAVPQKSRLIVVVYDATGRVVRRLFDGPANAGERRLSWNGRSDSNSPLASGVYFARVRSGEKTATARLVLLK